VMTMVLPRIPTAIVFPSRSPDSINIRPERD
jgi:hypothetical protein